MTRTCKSPLKDQIERLASINSAPGGDGITREVFTDEYMAAHEYVAGLMRGVGMSVRTDAFGNLHGSVAGSERAPAVLTGSHIDTTLNAGRYDGVFGVLGAIEAIRRLLESGYRPRAPIQVICFAGEEPRFGSGCLGSRALVGSLGRADLDVMRDREGISIARAMRGVGLDPDRIQEAQVNPAHVRAFVELHIEQGNVLESRTLPIGVVTHIAAPHELLVNLRTATVRAGDHAGDVSLRARPDAVAAAAEMVLDLERLASSSSSGTTVGTIGSLHALPGAPGVVSTQVALQVDVRDHDLSARTAVVNGFRDAVSETSSRRGLAHQITTIVEDTPVACSEFVVDAARTACRRLEIGFLEMASGAYHDAMVLGMRMPIGMIFVPSDRGISHSPLEYTSPEQLELGVRVLAETLRNLAGGDQRRHCSSQAMPAAPPER